MIQAQMFGIKDANLTPVMCMLTYFETYTDMAAAIRLAASLIKDPYNDWTCILIKTQHQTLCIPKYHIQHDSPSS